MNRIALFLCIAGCFQASNLPGTTPWFEQNRTGKQSLAQRAAFDLGCPAPSLQYQQLGSNWRTVGVAGCDKHATYVFDDSRALWVQNSEARAASK